MIFSTPELIRFISASIALQPGDLITRGTFLGFGRASQPVPYVSAGDDICAEIDRFRRPSNRIVAEDWAHRKQSNS